jgi:ABC-type amino acid transport substrate-binding protein
MNRSLGIPSMRRWLLGLAAALLFAGPLLAAPLRVLSYKTYPFFYLENGQPAGFEYELLKLFAQGHQRELEVQWVDVWDDILPMLQRGDGDILAATCTITPERQAEVDFSESYFPVRIVLVEPRGPQTHDLKELAGATVATIRGTTYEKVLSAIPQVKFVYAETERALFELVAAHKARALAVDSPVAIVLLRDFNGLEFGMSLSDEQNYGFAMRKGSPLRAELNELIRQLKISGTYYRLLEKYFGSLAVEVVQAGRVN